jgi:hypothetical protein
VIKMEIGEIVDIETAQIEGEKKWHEACDKWDYRTGGMPFVGFYMWFHDDGSIRKTGYVLRYGEHSYHWFKTKKEAIAYWEKIKEKESNDKKD